MAATERRVLLGWCMGNLPDGQHEKCPARVDTWGDQALVCTCGHHVDGPEDKEET